MITLICLKTIYINSKKGRMEVPEDKTPKLDELEKGPWPSFVNWKRKHLRLKFLLFYASTLAKSSFATGQSRP